MLKLPNLNRSHSEYNAYVRVKKFNGLGVIEERFLIFVCGSGESKKIVFETYYYTPYVRIENVRREICEPNASICVRELTRLFATGVGNVA